MISISKMKMNKLVYNMRAHHSGFYEFKSILHSDHCNKNAIEIRYRGLKLHVYVELCSDMLRYHRSTSMLLV